MSASGLARYTLTAATLLAVATACGGTDAPGSTATSAAETTTTAPQAGTTAASGITVSDAWVKAAPDVSSTSMTAVFGTLTNNGSAPVTITSATTTATGTTELHETGTEDGEAMMREAEGGFEIAPGASHELRPGGDHIMVMELTEPVPPGEVVTVTMTTDTGETIDFDAVAREFTGADERYGSEHGTETGMATSTP